MERKVIGLDFDDVLLHCFKDLVRFNNDRYGTKHELHEFTSYQPTELWGCDYTEVMRRVKEFHESDYARKLQPIEGAVEAVTKLATDYDLVIVTMRPPETESFSRELLKQFPDVFKHIHFLGSWEGTYGKKNKADICKEAGAALFVDDGLYNAETLSKAGIPVLLFDAPWNQTDTLPDLVTRVRSWEEALEKIPLLIQ
jgi:5'(3')-deoxyribonucleotidase